MKRPIVWCFFGLLFLFFFYRLSYGQTDDKKNYCLLYEKQQLDDVEVMGTVNDVSEKEKSTVLVISKVRLIGEKPKVANIPKKLLIIVQSSEAIQPGYIGTFQGAITEIQAPSNPGQFNQREYYRQQNIYYQMLASSCHIVKKKTTVAGVLYQLRRQIMGVYVACLPREEAGVAASLFLGEKQFLTAEIRGLYQQSGIAHLLSISGLHVALLGMGSFQFLLHIFRRWTPAIIITSLLLVSYGMMTGFGISTSRAVIMMLLSMGAVIVGRSYDSVTAMAFSGLFILCQKPFSIYSSGFLLSYGSVLGICFIRPYLEKIILGEDEEQRRYYRVRHRKNIERKNNMRHYGVYQFFYNSLYAGMELLLCSFSIQIATLPIILYFFYEFPLYGIFLNLIIIPLSSFLLLFCILGGSVGLLNLFLGRFLLGSVYFLLLFYESVCRIFSKIPHHSVITGRPSLSAIVVYYLVLFFVLSLPRIINWNCEKRSIKVNNRIVYFVALCVCLCFLGSLCKPKKPPCLQVDFMDVGQGDGIILRNDTGHVFLVDSGSTTVKEEGKYRLIPCLKYYGVSEVDSIILTHPDEDHMNGLLELMESSKEIGIVVKRMLLPKMEKEEESYKNIINLAKKMGILIQYLHTGDVICDGDLRMECLHPREGFEDDSTNAYSVTLSVSYRNYKLLLTGDLEGQGEEDVRTILTEKREQGMEGYDLLKVSHHGSKNATSKEFLEVCNPRYAVLSVGAKNRYGHPHEELLERLREQKVSFLATKDVGDIIVRFDEKGMSVKGFLLSEKVIVE